MAAGLTAWRQHLPAALVLAVGYGALAGYSRALAALAGAASFVWPADGLALGFLLVSRRRAWPLYLAIVFAMNLATSRGAFGHALVYAAFNVLEPLTVALAIEALLGRAPRLNRVRAIVVAGAAITVLMAALTALAAGAHCAMLSRDFMTVWPTWYVADTMGMLVLGMLVVCACHEARHEWRTRIAGRVPEALAVLAGLMIVTHLFHAVLPGSGGVGEALASTPMAGPALFLLWAALRFGMTGATVTMAMLALQAYWYAASGLGPMGWRGTPAPLLHLQLMLGLVDVIVLLVAATSVERVDAHAASESARQRLELAIRTGDMLVFEADPATGNVTWSGDTAAVLGREGADISNVADWIARVHPDDRDAAAAAYRSLAEAAPGMASLDIRIGFGPGPAWRDVGITAHAVAGGDGPRVVGFLKDVTAKKRQSAERLSLEARLRQAEKMEAVGRLAGGLAHDFNNIMGAILGYAEMLRDALPPGAEARRQAGIITEAAERGQALVTQILTFSRSGTREMEPVDVGLIIEEVESVIVATLPAGVTFTLSLPAAPAVVRGSGNEIYQLVMNLAANAVQALGGAGEVRLTLAEVAVDAPRALLAGSLTPGPYAVITVQDRGSGIAPEVLPRIFEPFFTTRTRDRGTGLGLPIVHGVVLGHVGALEVDSAPGAGSTFSVYLPALPGATVTTGALPAGRGETILVVDDEPGLVALAEDLLAQLGYEPLGYTDSEAALAAFLADPDRFDAILTDEVMPGLTGSELCARVRAAGGHAAAIPVVVVTGYGGDGFEARAREAGVTRVMKKPYRKRALAASVAAVLGR